MRDDAFAGAKVMAFAGRYDKATQDTKRRHGAGANGEKRGERGKKAWQRTAARPTSVQMNTSARPGSFSREVVRMSTLLEPKLERHAGLLLWTFAPIAVSGVFFHHPNLTGGAARALANLFPLALLSVLVPLLSWCVGKSPVRHNQPASDWCLFGALKAAQVLGQVLICALGGFLALFVLCAVHRELAAGATALLLGALTLAGLAEAACVERRLAAYDQPWPSLQCGWLKLSGLSVFGWLGFTAVVSFALVHLPNAVG